MVKLCGESVVCQVDLEELHGCFDGLLHEDQVLCERRDSAKQGGWGNEGKTEVIRVRQEDVMGEGKRGQ